MPIMRLLNDTEVLAGERLFDARQRSYTFVEQNSGELVVKAADGRLARFKPAKLGCYAIHLDRTKLGLAKEKLKSFWVEL